MSQRAVDIDDRETIVVGAAIVAVVLAVVYRGARIGFASHDSEILRSLGLSLFISAIPYWGWRALRRSGSDLVWYRTQPLLAVAAVAFTGLLAVVAAPVAESAGLVISVLGAVAAALVLFSWFRNGAYRSRFLFSLAALLMAVWSAGVVWTSRYKLPLFFEQLMTTANIHHDPLYVVTLGNMLRTYGIGTTGLDGVPYTPYHYGSSWLLTRWADLIGTDTLSLYSLGYAVVLIPFFLAAIAMLAVECRRISPLPVAHGWLRSNWWGWLALAVATIGVLPESALFGMAVWNAHVLISESYLLGLPIFLLVIATGCVVWRAGKADMAYLFVFLPLALAALGFLKISLMVLLFALAVYAVVRVPFFRTVIGFVSLLVMFGACFATYQIVALASHNGGVVPFHFIRTSVAPGWQQFFPLIHFAWTWVYVGGRLFEEGISDVGELRSAVRERSIVDVEMMLGLTLLAFLPGAVFFIHGGSAIYFSDVPRWVALAAVMSRAPHWYRLWRERHYAPPRLDGSLRVRPFVVGLLLAPFAVTMLFNVLKPPVRLLRQNLVMRTMLVSQAGLEPELAAGNRRLLFDPGVLSAGLERSKHYDLISSLRAIRGIPAAERSEMLLFIPQSYREFWTIFDADRRCTFAPLVATSVASTALLDGMPYYGCVITDQYNMQVYSPRDREQSALDRTQPALCARARAHGFGKVLVLQPGESGKPAPRMVTCPSAG